MSRWYSHRIHQAVPAGILLNMCHTQRAIVTSLWFRFLLAHKWATKLHSCSPKPCLITVELGTQRLQVSCICSFRISSASWILSPCLVTRLTSLPLSEFSFKIFLCQWTFARFSQSALTSFLNFSFQREVANIQFHSSPPMSSVL